MRTRLLALACVALLCPVFAESTAAVSKEKTPAAKAKAPAVSAQAKQWMAKMTLRDRVAQLVMVPFYGDSPNVRSKEYREFASLVRDLKVGGLIIINRTRQGTVQKSEPHATSAFLNRMQRLARVPLICGADFERGASMRMATTTTFPYMMAFGATGDTSLTRALGAATAREARAMGFHWVFAPDADVNNNPDNPIINIRSFSESPEAVAAHVRAFIEGAHADPKTYVLTTAKHFPGHGDTDVDSHMNLARVTASRERLEQLEFVPFKAAIAAGTDSVMSAHLAVPALEPEEKPATVSKNVLTGVLRDEFKFTGLVTTDALEMQGITKMYGAGEAAVRALEAGADLLLMPANPREAVNAVMAAIKQGRISKQRVDESLARLLNAKVKVGLAKRKLVDIESVPDALATDEDDALAAKVARKAITLVRNEGNVLPLAHPEKSCWYVLSASRFSRQGADLVDAIRKDATGAKVNWLEPTLAPEEYTTLAAKSRESCEVNVVAAYVTVAAFTGNVALPGGYPAFMDALTSEGSKPLVFLALGNPYLLRAFPKVQAYMAAFSTTPTSEAAIVKAVTGAAPVTGKLPVTIPGYAKLGDGLTLNAK